MIYTFPLKCIAAFYLCTFVPLKVGQFCITNLHSIRSNFTWVQRYIIRMAITLRYWPCTYVHTRPLKLVTIVSLHIPSPPFCYQKTSFKMADNFAAPSNCLKFFFILLESFGILDTIMKCVFSEDMGNRFQILIGNSSQQITYQWLSTLPAGPHLVECRNLSM